MIYLFYSIADSIYCLSLLNCWCFWLPNYIDFVGIFFWNIHFEYFIRIIIRHNSRQFTIFQRQPQKDNHWRKWKVIKPKKKTTTIIIFNGIDNDMYFKKRKNHQNQTNFIKCCCFLIIYLVAVNYLFLVFMGFLLFMIDKW